MPPRDRLARIVRWLERQGRWINSADLHLWQQANLGSSRAKRAHDIRALVKDPRIERRVGVDGRFEYCFPPDVPQVIPAHILALRRIERRLADDARRRPFVAIPLRQVEEMAG